MYYHFQSMTYSNIEDRTINNRMSIPICTVNQSSLFWSSFDLSGGKWCLQRLHVQTTWNFRLQKILQTVIKLVSQKTWMCDNRMVSFCKVFFCHGWVFIFSLIFGVGWTFFDYWMVGSAKLLPRKNFSSVQEFARNNFCKEFPALLTCRERRRTGILGRAKRTVCWSNTITLKWNLIQLVDIIKLCTQFYIHNFFIPFRSFSNFFAHG
jgi:hypothetical protein